MKKIIVRLNYSTQFAFDTIEEALKLLTALDGAVIVDDDYVNNERVYHATSKELYPTIIFQPVLTLEAFTATKTPAEPEPANNYAEAA